MDGLFIPNEIAKLNTLNWTEKVLLSIYWYRNNGKLKCCKMRNEDIYKELMVSKNTFHRMKTHLKELGYIRTDGGIRVYYLGVGNDVKETETVDEVDEKVDETEITENEKVIEGYCKICENNPNTLFYTMDYKDWDDPRVVKANKIRF